MKIAERYSHLNGYEFIQYHHAPLWREIETVIGGVNAALCRTKISKELRTRDKLLYSPKALNAAYHAGFAAAKWSERRTKYWVTDDAQLIRKTLALPPADQKAAITQAGRNAHASYNQTDFVKDRVAVEVQFGKYAFVTYDLFVKHMAFYVGNVIDVGIEILPMKVLQQQMSSGIGYYEGELYNLIREGRGVPAVPLILIGVVP